MFLDFHGEATSEKVAMATWLDGRVTAVVGTHTHVQTSDARVLPGGTAAITDAGMTGPHDSVIGVKSELAISRMRERLPVRFEPAEGGVRLEGVVVTCTDDGKARGSRRSASTPEPRSKSCRSPVAGTSSAIAANGKNHGMYV